ncbi:hypothetical protein PR048_021320 [Dryococelus australis]|uniref:Uncharacterized protein n=1 Tax=Dryococelus australis TaxID=614101 RepID=A0ABQ9GXU4_9NEOP|nr:hypothetical protein PR048_021320 [Dryococelus australis]
MEKMKIKGSRSRQAPPVPPRCTDERLDRRSIRAALTDRAATTRAITAAVSPDDKRADAAGMNVSRIENFYFRTSMTAQFVVDPEEKEPIYIFALWELTHRPPGREVWRRGQRRNFFEGRFTFSCSSAPFTFNTCSSSWTSPMVPGVGEGVCVCVCVGEASGRSVVFSDESHLYLGKVMVVFVDVKVNGVIHRVFAPDIQPSSGNDHRQLRRKVQRAWDTVPQRNRLSPLKEASWDTCVTERGNEEIQCADYTKSCEMHGTDEGMLRDGIDSCDNVGLEFFEYELVCSADDDTIRLQHRLNARDRCTCSIRRGSILLKVSIVVLILRQLFRKNIENVFDVTSRVHSLMEEHVSHRASFKGLALYIQNLYDRLQARIAARVAIRTGLYDQDSDVSFKTALQLDVSARGDGKWEYLKSLSTTRQCTKTDQEELTRRFLSAPTSPTSAEIESTFVTLSGQRFCRTDSIGCYSDTVGSGQLFGFGHKELSMYLRLCSFPKLRRVRFPAGSLPDFSVWESCRAGFLGNLPFPPALFIPGLLHTHLDSPSSTLKTSKLTAAQISPLTPELQGLRRGSYCNRTLGLSVTGNRMPLSEIETEENPNSGIREFNEAAGYSGISVAPQRRIKFLRGSQLPPPPLILTPYDFSGRTGSAVMCHAVTFGIVLLRRTSGLGRRKSGPSVVSSSKYPRPCASRYNHGVAGSTDSDGVTVALNWACPSSDWLCEALGEQALCLIGYRVLLHAPYSLGYWLARKLPRADWRTAFRHIGEKGRSRHVKKGHTPTRHQAKRLRKGGQNQNLEMDRHDCTPKRHALQTFYSEAWHGSAVAQSHNELRRAGGRDELANACYPTSHHQALPSLSDHREHTPHTSDESKYYVHEKKKDKRVVMEKNVIMFLACGETIAGREVILQTFSEMASKEIQATYLATLVLPTPVQRRRSKDAKNCKLKCSSYTYRPKDPLKKTGGVICQKVSALCSPDAPVRLLTSHQVEPGSISGRIIPGFFQVGIVPDAITGQRVFSGISRFQALLHSPLISLSSALKTSLLRAAIISQLTRLTNSETEEHIGVKTEQGAGVAVNSVLLNMREMVDNNLGAGRWPDSSANTAYAPSIYRMYLNSTDKLRFEYGAALDGGGGKGKREIPKKTHRPTASPRMIPTCESPVTRPGIEPGPPWWEVSVLTAQLPRPHLSGISFAVKSNIPPKRKAIGRSTPQAKRKKASRASETDEQREVRLETARVRAARFRRTLHADLDLGAFHYDANYDYSLHPSGFKRLQFPVRLAFAMTIKQGTKTIATSMLTKFGKSMLLTWTAICGLLTRRKTF